MDFMPHRTIYENDAVYPQNFRDAGIKSCLYTLGDYQFSNTDTFVGVIGCRKPSVYGQLVTQKVVAELIYHRCVVVSGFMYGIDIQAHNAAIENGGRTVCVLGYGLDHLQKNTPQAIINRFASTGAFLTEYEQTIGPKKWTYAKRNRIIAGLCALLIVIEAEQKSGSFITCYWAKKFNRQVFAVPGSVLSEKSVGTNQLIQSTNAHMLCSVSELGSILKIEGDRDLDSTQDSDNVCNIVQKALYASPLDFDQLYKHMHADLGFNQSKLLNLLATMELENKITRTGNIYYVQ